VILISTARDGKVEGHDRQCRQCEWKTTIDDGSRPGQLGHHLFAEDPDQIIWDSLEDKLGKPQTPCGGPRYQTLAVLKSRTRRENAEEDRYHEAEDYVMIERRTAQIAAILRYRQRRFG
jgi:hypothetical protein